MFLLKFNFFCTELILKSDVQKVIASHESDRRTTLSHSMLLFEQEKLSFVKVFRGKDVILVFHFELFYYQKNIRLLYL